MAKRLQQTDNLGEYATRDGRFLVRKKDPHARKCKWEMIDTKIGATYDLKRMRDSYRLIDKIRQQPEVIQQKELDPMPAPLKKPIAIQGGRKVRVNKTALFDPSVDGVRSYLERKYPRTQVMDIKLDEDMHSYTARLVDVNDLWSTVDAQFSKRVE